MNECLDSWVKQNYSSPSFALHFNHQLWGYRSIIPTHRLRLTGSVAYVWNVLFNIPTLPFSVSEGMETLHITGPAGNQKSILMSKGIFRWKRLFAKNLSAEWITSHVDGSASSREAHTARYRCTCRAKKGMSIFSISSFWCSPLRLLQPALLPLSISLSLPF